MYNINNFQMLRILNLFLLIPFSADFWKSTSAHSVRSSR